MGQDIYNLKEGEKGYESGLDPDPYPKTLTVQSFKG